MTITRLQAVHVRVPLGTPYLFSRGAMDAFESVIVRMETESGAVGYGECAPLFKSPTGDASFVLEVLRQKIAPMAIGWDPADRNRIGAEVLKTADGNLDVLCGVDLALWDLFGIETGQPVYRLMGGSCQDRVAVDYTLSAGTPEKMAARALEICEAGFQGVVVKVTGGDLSEDVARVKAVRDCLPDSATVRVDCNGAYDRPEALSFLRAISGLGVELVEQPVARSDREGLALCREPGIPISVDESLKTEKDALALIAGAACDLMNVKVANVGGLTMAMRMAALAGAAEKPVIVGGRTSLEICRAASRHLAISTPGAVGIKHEGPGPASQDLTGDVVENRITIEDAAAAGGFVRPADRPGLGVQVSWEKVMAYAVEEGVC